LKQLPKNQVISILSNQTIYRFRISDIIIIWSEAILHRNGLFSEPQYPKNPHTNQYFKIHNLYNLYFSIFNSNFHMPLDIGAIFKVHFNIKSFKRYYLPLLRERIILIYYQEASNYEIYEYILTMLEKFRSEIGSIYIPHLPTQQEKEQILIKMRHFVLLYLRATLSCNPAVRSENKEKLMLDLTDFIDDEDNSEIIYRIGRQRSSAISTDYPRMFPSQPLLPLPPPPPINIIRRAPPPPPPPPRPPSPPLRILSPHRPLRIPPSLNLSSFSNNLTTTRLPHIRQRVSQPTELQNRFTNRLYRIDTNAERVIFRPRQEIPRTPERISNIVNTYDNTSLRHRLRF